MFFIESSGQIFHYYKLQTCHPSQHLEKASEKKSARGTTKKSAYTNWDCNKPLLFPFFRWVHPWLAVPLIIIVIIKSFSASSLATRVFFFPKNCFIFRKSTTNSQLNACTFSAGGPNCGRESLLCCLPLRESNTKLLFPSASSGEETGKIPPSVSLFLFLSLLVSVTFWASRTHTMHAHTHTVQPTLSKSSLGLHIALFCGLLRAWLHALFIPQAYSFHQCRRN